RAARVLSQFVTRPWRVPELFSGAMQSLPVLLSSFAKHPFVGSLPPVYLSIALVTQADWSAGLPGVWEVARHFRIDARSFDTHFFLPAPHFVWVIGAGSIACTNDPTQLSTAASAAPLSPDVMQSFPGLFSSFAKQPLLGSAPPENLPSTLVTQSFALGSAGLPGVSASVSHLSNPVALLDMHFVFPATHFFCTWADAEPPHANVSVNTSAVTIERVIMEVTPPRPRFSMMSRSVASPATSCQAGPSRMRRERSERGPDPLRYTRRAPLGPPCRMTRFELPPAIPCLSGQQQLAFAP